MPPILSRPIAIIQEWAVLLDGLCMNVPNSWWAGNTGLLLNVGAFSHLNFHQQNELYFQLEVDDTRVSTTPCIMMQFFFMQTKAICLLRITTYLMPQ
jgi:hypothetical protein